MLMVQLKILATSIDAETCQIYIACTIPSLIAHGNSLSFAPICEFNRTPNQQLVVAKQTNANEFMAVNDVFRFEGNEAVVALAINDNPRSGYIKVTFSSESNRDVVEEGSRRHQHIVEMMSLTAKAVSAVISSEQSKLKMQSEVVAYLDHLEMQRVVVRGRARNAMQAMLTLVSLLRPRLPRQDELSSELLDNIAVQAESVFAAVAVLTDQPSPVDEDLEISLEESRKPVVDADIWRGLKEETLLDLPDDNIGTSNTAAAS